MSGPQPDNETPTRRVRVRYTVRGKVRFLSHRDVARVMERAIRRAGVPVAYTHGYSPRPKVAYGLALPTGYESDGEYIDIYLDRRRAGVTDLDEMAIALSASLPSGLEVAAVAEVAAEEGSLQDSVHSTSWMVLIDGVDQSHGADQSHGVGHEELSTRADALLDASSHEIEIIRKGKQVREDLRPLLLGLSVTSEEGHTVLQVELGTKPRSIRPSELLAALGVPEALLVRRTNQWTRRDGERAEPLALDAPSPRANACAS